MERLEACGDVGEIEAAKVRVESSTSWPARSSSARA